MAATAVKIPYADASPAELREAILPEDVPSFDEQYRDALRVAAETLRLDELESFLAHWRRIAWSANAYGHDHWRAVLARAEQHQAAQRREAADTWHDHDLVFCRDDGTPLDRWQVRREFQKITQTAGLGHDWTPRELRHSFVSILSNNGGVRIEDISDLVGHSGTSVTETVYRHEIRPALTKGATAMNKILKTKQTKPMANHLHAI